jgi:hypothetical protein
MVLFGDSLTVEASASGATNTATFLAFGLAPIGPQFIAGHSIGTIWPPTRSWRPKRGARALASPHRVRSRSPAQTRLAIMSVVFTGPVDFAATDGV